MSLIVANRIQETCISPGTGPVALLGAAIQYVSFSSKLSNGDTTFYVIADAVGTNWEVGIGTYASSGNTLARTTVLSSSNSGSLVNFSSGTQNVWNDYPAEYAIYASNNASQASGQSLISSGVGTPPTWGNPVAPSGSPGYYGQFYDTTTQTASSSTVDYLVGCATTSISNGVSVSSGRITVANAGIYNFQFSLQLANTTSTISTASVWVRYNGVDVANSSSSVGVPIKHGSVNGLMLLALNQVFNMAAGDYIELWWQSDVAGVTIATIPSTSGPTVPQSPAVIYTMTQQAQIGIGYSGLTSTTSTLIGTGSKVFTTNLTSTQTAFAVGTRVRVAYSVTPANFMEGVVTAFSSTTFTVNIDSIGGSGTFASWTVSVAGIQGSNGVTSFSGNSTGLTPSTATTGAISLAGTLNVLNGGTGATTLTGVLKGNGTGAFTAATSGTDYSAGTSALATGILKSTTSTGALTIAVAADFPTLNQNTTGTAAGLSATLAIASGGTNSTATPTAGGVGYGTGTAHAFTAAGTTGQVLTSNGAAAPTWATASGGGIATGASYTNPTAAGTAAAAFGSSASAGGANALALGTSANASGTNTTAIGYNSSGTGSQAVTGAGAMALGGSYASGTDSFAAAITNNTSSYGAQSAGAVAIGGICVASGSTSSVAIGYQAGSTGGRSVAIGYQAFATSSKALAIGDGCTAGDNGVALGISASASGAGSVAISGTASATGARSFGGTASGVNAISLNGLAAQTGKYTFTGTQFSTLGDAQYGKIVLRASTTTTTAVVLTSDGAAASTNNQLIAASGQAMAIQGTLIAKVSGTGAMAGWNITGIVSNNAGTMAVSGLALTAIGSDSITLGAQPTIAVDNTNKGVTITSGYKSATSIRWVCCLNTSEVTY